MVQAKLDEAYTKVGRRLRKGGMGVCLPIDVLLSNGPVRGVVLEAEIHPRQWQRTLKASNVTLGGE